MEKCQKRSVAHEVNLTNSWLVVGEVMKDLTTENKILMERIKELELQNAKLKSKRESHSEKQKRKKERLHQKRLQIKSFLSNEGRDDETRINDLIEGKINMEEFLTRQINSYYNRTNYLERLFKNQNNFKEWV